MRRVHDLETDPRALSDLFKDLRDDTTNLVRQEIALAKSEMRQKAQRIARDSTYVAIGAALALTAWVLLCITLAAAMAALFDLFLIEEVAVWLGPLVATLILGAIAAGLIAAGIRKLRKRTLMPEQTTESLQEDKQWMKERLTR